jgi:EAL domain-containing protein (putative c-di-GMP-specific phosphodiesterase class I)
MSRLITGFGYQVTIIPSLITLDFAKLTASDIIFVDLMMPELDGIQVLDLLARKQVKSSIVPMSGTHREVLATADTIARRSGLRVIGVLNKPFRSLEVRRILQEEQPEPQQLNKKLLAPEINIEDVLAGLEHKEFDVFFQPIIDLSTQRPVSYEALARWRSEKFSLVMPDRFIGIAAHNGVLPRLTRQIVHRTLAYAAILKDRGLASRVSINVGAEDLVDEKLPEKLAKIIANHNLPVGSLTLELTESSATANEIAMFGILARMRLKGIDLAIDDFGTSYSGLDRLSSIPFTSLKIDRQFISAMMTNRNARMIVESSIVLAKRLKITTVAEGIETEDQLSILKMMGCDHGQGYLFAPPMEFEKLLAWAADQLPRPPAERSTGFPGETQRV